MVPRPEASQPLGTVLEMQILRHPPETKEWETLGMEPGNLDFFQPLGDCEDICQVGEPLIQAVDQGKDEQQQVC